MSRGTGGPGGGRGCRVSAGVARAVEWGAGGSATGLIKGPSGCCVESRLEGRRWYPLEGYCGTSEAGEKL